MSCVRFFMETIKTQYLGILKASWVLWGEKNILKTIGLFFLFY